MRRLGRSVAQPGRALCSGRRGRRFKSSHSDQLAKMAEAAPSTSITRPQRGSGRKSRGVVPAAPCVSGSVRIELEKRGVARYDWRDPYYLAVALSWPWFLFFAVAAFCILNSVFAVSLHGAARIGR